MSWDDGGYERMCKAVDASLGDINKELKFVIFSAYDSKRGPCVSALKERAFEGKGILVQEADEFWAGINDMADVAKDYQSKVLTNPSWLTICKCANEMILATKDFHHVFLESVYKTKKEINGIPVYSFSMGS